MGFNAERLLLLKVPESPLGIFRTKIKIVIRFTIPQARLTALAVNAVLDVKGVFFARRNNDIALDARAGDRIARPARAAGG